MRPRREWITPVVLALVPVLAYREVLSYAYPGNDFFTLLNVAVTEPLFTAGQFGAYYRPVLYTTYAIEHLLTGIAPATFQTTTLLLHAAVTVLVYLAGRTLFGSRRTGTVAALLFALHPATMTVIPNPILRPEVLAAAGMLLTLLMLRRLRDDPRPRWLILSAATALLTYLSKESAVILLPVVLTVLWQDRDVLGGALAQRAALVHAATLGIYLTARVLVLPYPFGLPRTFGLADSGPAMIVAGFARQLVAPFRPDAFPGISGTWVPAATAIGLILLAGIAVLAATRIRTAREDAGTAPVLPLATWILALAALYVAVGRMTVWYGYLAVPPLALVTAHIIGRLPDRPATAITAVLVLAAAATTPLFMDYPGYEMSSKAMHDTVPKMVERLDTVPDGSDVIVPVTFTGSAGTMYGEGMPGYAFLSLVDLLRPDRTWRVHPVMRFHVPAADRPFTIATRVNRTGETVRVTVTGENIGIRDADFTTRLRRSLSNTTSVTSPVNGTFTVTPGDATYLLTIDGTDDGITPRIVDISRP